MKKLFIAVLFVLFGTKTFAQDFLKGANAYEAGDYATAIKEWKPLAEQGSAIAQYFLGALYDYGEGVFQDYPEAVKWYRLSAEQGNASAQNILGLMYENGNGVLKDTSEAVKWHRLSAEQGNASAQGDLGAMYANGNGVLQDNITSHMWYNIASANGNEKAGAKRDKREGLMTPSDISKATAMARECMKSEYKKCGY